MKRRVVITGMGLVTPLGIGVENTWTNLCAGISGISEITRFDASNFPTKIAGEVKNFRPEDFLSQKDAKRMHLFIAYAIAAGRMALEDSKFIINSSNADKIGIVMGCGLGGLSTLEDTVKVLTEKGPKRVSPFFIPMMIGNMAPGVMSIQFGAKGPNLSIATACAAGTHAIGEAFKLIKQSVCDAVITGGVESVITPTCIAGFSAMKALSSRNNEPTKASRPFDKDRDGFVVGEGSGILIIEDLNHALERGAKIYAEVIGFGTSSDAYHMTAPTPEGEGAARCMLEALKDAQISYLDINYINAHGTSTPFNDLCETMAIKNVFKEKAKFIPVSSTKSMTGHLLGGAGGVEAVFTALSIANNIIPPTINLDNPDENCDLDYVPNVARKANIDIAMSNSFGFGGTNGTLIFKKYKI